MQTDWKNGGNSAEMVCKWNPESPPPDRLQELHHPKGRLRTVLVRRDHTGITVNHTTGGAKMASNEFPVAKFCEALAEILSEKYGAKITVASIREKTEKDAPKKAG